MNKFTCKDCNREFDTYKGLQSHRTKTHKISGAQTYVDIYCDGQWPKCKCGCDQLLNYFSTFGFGEYLRGHATRVNGGFYSPLGAKRSGETRRIKFASGELEQWNKGIVLEGEELERRRIHAKDPVRREKISKALTGKPKSEEHKKIMVETLARNRKEILKGNPSKLEFTFAEILAGLGIEFIHQYDLNGFNYDFYIPSKNILIEVDGDYWHCNPTIEKFKTPVHEWHYENIKRDEKKNKWAEENGYTLLRFWEHDIQNNRLEVIQTLIDLLSS